MTIPWHVSRTVIGIVVAIACVSILAVSLAQLTSSPPSLLEKQERSHISLQQRFTELLSFPILPDSPLYSITMVGERIVLLTTPTNDLIPLKLSYANARLRAAQILLSRYRLALALTTLTKSSKYLLSAAVDIQLANAWQTQQGQQVLQAIRDHKQTMRMMRPYFAEEQQSIVDDLQNQLQAVMQGNE